MIVWWCIWRLGMIFEKKKKKEKSPISFTQLHTMFTVFTVDITDSVSQVKKQRSKAPKLSSMRRTHMIEHMIYTMRRSGEVSTAEWCIKATAYVQFFNFLVQLLSKCGFLFLRAFFICNVLSLKNLWKQSSTMGHVQWKRNLTLWMSRNWFKMQANILVNNMRWKFARHGWKWAAIFKPQLLFECGSRAFEFGQSALWYISVLVLGKSFTE